MEKLSFLVWAPNFAALNFMFCHVRRPRSVRRYSCNNRFCLVLAGGRVHSGKQGWGVSDDLLVQLQWKFVSFMKDMVISCDFRVISWDFFQISWWFLEISLWFLGISLRILVISCDSLWFLAISLVIYFVISLNIQI